MTGLEELFDIELFDRMQNEKFIRQQTHPTLPLNIINYTEQAQYKREWNEVTLNCRGLIYNYDTGEIVARGFPKFFNWDDSSQPYPPHGPVLRSPKMDGSLGILYPDYSDNPHTVIWRVATRGSFASDQASWATSTLWLQHAAGDLDLTDLNPAKSYLCEIIYPENRIVVDYGTQERLTLLDVLDTATGKTDLEEFDRVYWLDPRWRRSTCQVGSRTQWPGTSRRARKGSSSTGPTVTTESR
jgi:RNA ligase